MDDATSEARKRRKEILKSQRNDAAAATPSDDGDAAKPILKKEGKAETVVIKTIPDPNKNKEAVPPAEARRRRREIIQSQRSEAAATNNTIDDDDAKMPAESKHNVDMETINDIDEDSAQASTNDAAAAPIKPPPPAAAAGAAKKPTKKRKASASSEGEMEKNALKATSTGPRKTQIRYDPEVPMSKEQLAAWRREARRVRNRESAAASRQRIRNRITELEEEADGWRDKYQRAMERLQQLERVLAQNAAENGGSDNHDEAAGVTA